MTGSILFVPAGGLMSIALAQNSLWVGLVSVLIALTGAFLMGWDAKSQSLRKAKKRRG